MRLHKVESELTVVEFPFCGQLAASLKPTERVVSISMAEVTTLLTLDESYRRASNIANRVYHRDGEDLFIPETLKARQIKMGDAVSSDYMSEACGILESHGIDKDTGIIDDSSGIPESAREPDLTEAVCEQHIAETVETFNEGRGDNEKIIHLEKVTGTEASADDCVYVCIDDVGVKHQKEQRNTDKEKDRKYVQNTVVHILCGDRQQTLTAIGMKNAFRLLVAFLLANGLMENRRLIFLTDGARDIKENIATFFGFREYTLILDWLHLKKKCKEYLSMAVKGCGKTKNERREDKAMVIRALLRTLWAGNVQEAISYLNGLDEKHISNQYWMGQLTDYIGRKQENIACYAFRHRLRLRISSNRVEKANDLLVAKRQKHAGMSWSEKGSGALAVITALSVNNRLGSWLRGEKGLLVMPEDKAA